MTPAAPRPRATRMVLPRLLTTRMVLRRLLANRWAVAVAVLLVAVSTGLTLGALRRIDAVQRDAVRAAVQAVGPGQRDLTGSVSSQPVSGPASRPAAPYDDLLTQMRGGPGRIVGPAAGQPTWSLSTPVLGLEQRPRPGPVDLFRLQVGSGWPERVRYVAGRAPRDAVPGRPPPGRRAGFIPQVPATIEVAMAAEPAASMRLRVGDLFEIAAGPNDLIPPLRLHLVGTYRALDPADPFWAPQPALLHGSLKLDQNIGEIWTGTALAPAASLPVLQGELATAPTVVTVRLPLRPDLISSGSVQALIGRLRAAQSQPVGIPDRTGGQFAQLSTGTIAALEQYERQQAPVRALALVFLASVLAVALVVLLLTFRLLLDRRAAGLALAAARGTSLVQALGQLFAEGLLIGACGAALGVLAALAVPGRIGPVGGPVLAVLAALAPAVVLPAAAIPLLWSPRPRRRRSGRAAAVRRRIAPARAAGGNGGSAVAAPGGARPPAAVRAWRGARSVAWSASGRGPMEVLLVLLAAAAVLALHRRGLTVAASPAPAPVPGAQAGSGAGGIDPLILAAPALVALAGAVLAGRLLAPVLAWTARRAAARRGVVAFLGLARAGRDAALGPLGLAGVVLALSTAVLAAQVGATLRTGAAQAAVQSVGADLRVRGFGLDAAQATAVARLPGLQRVTPLTEVDGASVSVLPSAAERDATVLAADPVALSEVQRDLTGGLPPETAALLAGAGSGRVPVVASRGMARVGDELTLRVTLYPVRARVVAVLAGMPAAPQDGPWLLVSLPALRAATGLVLSSQSLLARVDPGRMPSQARLESAVGDIVTADTPDGVARQATTAPMVAAVSTGMPLAFGLGAGFTGAAVMLSLLAGSRRRSRFLAHLRALGLSTGQAGALVGFEVVPPSVAALLAGPVCGLALGATLLPAADLRPLTGAVLPPSVSVPLGLVALIVLATGCLVAVMALLAVAAGRTVSPAAAARLAEGG